MAEQEAGQQSLSPRRAVQTLLQHIHEGSYGGGGEGVVVCLFFPFLAAGGVKRWIFSGTDLRRWKR